MWVLINCDINISVKFAFVMETPSLNVLWSCFENEKEKRWILENQLPQGFSYKINKFKLMKESAIPHESKFDASFLVNVCSEEKADLFVKDLERETGTNFNSFRGKSESYCSHYQKFIPLWWRQRNRGKLYCPISSVSCCFTKHANNFQKKIIWRNVITIEF